MGDDDLRRALRAAANELDVDDTPPMAAIAAGHRSVARRRRILTLAAVVALVVVGFVVTAATSDRSANEQIHTIGHDTVAGHLDLAPGRSVVRITARPGAAVDAISTQRGVAGVWALTSSDRAGTSRPAVFSWEVRHFDAVAGRTTSWSLGAIGTLAGARSLGFSACRDHVWVGAGDQLRRLDPGTGTVATVTLPHVPTVGSTVGRVASVDSIACLDDGSLLIAPHLGTSLLELDPRTGRFTTVPLPDQAYAPGAARDTSKFFHTGVTTDASGHAAIRIGAFPMGGIDAQDLSRTEPSPVFVLDAASGKITSSGVSTSEWPIGMPSGFAIPTSAGLTTLTVDDDGDGHAAVHEWPAAVRTFGSLVGFLPDGRAVLADATGGRIAVVDLAHGNRIRHVSVPGRWCRWSSQLPRTATATGPSPETSGSPATTPPAPTTTEPHLACLEPPTSTGRTGGLEGFMATDGSPAAVSVFVDDAGNVFFTKDQSPLVQQIGVPAR
jgi:hypothetical protein